MEVCVILVLFLGVEMVCVWLFVVVVEVICIVVGEVGVFLSVIMIIVLLIVFLVVVGVVCSGVVMVVLM